MLLVHRILEVGGPFWLLDLANKSLQNVKCWGEILDFKRYAYKYFVWRHYQIQMHKGRRSGFHLVSEVSEVDSFIWNVIAMMMIGNEQMVNKLM